MTQQRQKKWNNQKGSSHLTREGNISRSYHFSSAWPHSTGHWQLFSHDKMDYHQGDHRNQGTNMGIRLKHIMMTIAGLTQQKSKQHVR
eukprot:5098735-Ditylum_brightwellii.AAC.2